MWDTFCPHVEYRLRYKTVSWPTGVDGSVILLDGYDASKWLRYCYTVKFIWSGEIKQMNEAFMWIYVSNYMSN